MIFFNFSKKDGMIFRYLHFCIFNEFPSFKSMRSEEVLILYVLPNTTNLLIGNYAGEEI